MPRTPEHVFAHHAQATQIYQDDILLLEWAADAHSTRVEDGIDTVVFRDGLGADRAAHAAAQGLTGR